MRVYDYIPASSVEDGDLVYINHDPVEVASHVDETDTIVVKGFSHMSGDNVVYFLTADSEVGLWTED